MRYRRGHPTWLWCKRFNRFKRCMGKNASRSAWRRIKHVSRGVGVKISTYDYQTPSGDVIPISYIAPTDLLTFLLLQYPALLVGGLQNQQERSEHLQAFWDAFKLRHGDHRVFSEHSDSLQSVVPLAWHGDEGRGKRRGNTVVVSIEASLGINTVLQQRKRRHESCQCTAPDSIKQRFGPVSKKFSDRTCDLLRTQWTSMRGHSFLQHFALFIIPSSVYHKHPQVLSLMLKLIATDLRRLFFEGVTVQGRHWCFSIVAGKGDLKWYCKVALERSFQNQGVVQDIPCCHECQAGSPGLAWEDLSDRPSWAGTRYTQRPWSTPPPMLPVPYCLGAPEKAYKRDLFHLMKVGILRDLAGSGICWFVRKGYFGEQGDIDHKLQACHQVFRLWCTTTGHTAALRTFSRLLFMYPRFSAYPWANTKGSDTMLLLKFICVQCVGFINAPLDPRHVPFLRLLHQTCQAAVKYFDGLNDHGLWFFRECVMTIFAELTKFITGYATLAAWTLNDLDFNGFGMKPKIHLVKHYHLEMAEMLASGAELFWNCNRDNCEMCEDFIGRICRLSRRLDSRRIGERVLHCSLLKCELLYKRFLRANRLR